MNKTLEEVNDAIADLSKHDERALEEISGGLESVHDSFEALQGNIQSLQSSQEIISEEMQAKVEAVRDAVADAEVAVTDSIGDAGATVARSIDEGGRNVRAGIDDVGKAISSGFGAVSGSVIAAGAMVMNALAGVGAVLQYRERMDQLRHKERLQFDEETSDAGRARRELKAAAAMLFAGDPSQAEAHVTNSLSLFPSSAETFRIRSIVENLKGEHLKASISLKAALKLAEDGDLLPQIMNVNETVVEGMREAVYVSSASQLANELALLSQESTALSLLEDGIEKYPKNTDLHLVRLRTLGKTPVWDDRFGDYVTQLVKLSPRYFNILFLDHQLGRRLNETQEFLKRLKSDTLVALRNKKRTLMVVSTGQAELAIAQTIEQGSGNFEELVATIGGVVQEIRRYAKP